VSRWRGGAGLAVGILLAAGCAPLGAYRLVESRPNVIGGVYTVRPRLAWATAARGRGPEAWTIDGVLLERLQFFTGIEDGQSLLKTTGDTRPRFSLAMTRREVAEFVADSLVGSRFPPRHVRPARFGDGPGFRFELSYATDDGVRRESLVIGAVIGGRLEVVQYDGTALFHFERYRDEAEAIIASITLLPGTPASRSRSGRPAQQCVQGGNSREYTGCLRNSSGLYFQNWLTWG